MVESITIATGMARLPEWVAEHQACWETAPILEVVKARGVQQTGHALRLFGRFRPGPDAEAAAAGIYANLCALASSALQSLPDRAMFRVEPPGRAVVPLESQLVVEVQLTIAVSCPGADGPGGARELRTLMTALEGRLRAMGLRKRG